MISYETIITSDIFIFSENCEEIDVSFYASDVDPHQCDHFAYGWFHQCSTGAAAATQCKVNQTPMFKI